MKTDTCVDAGHKELVGAKASYQRGGMGIFGSRGPTPVRLGKAEGHGGLPVTKIDLLRGSARLFDRGLHFAIEFQLRDLAAHGSDQREVVGVHFERLIAKDVP